VARGDVDLEALGRATPEELSDDEVASRVIAFPALGRTPQRRLRC
jgi:hypothetical protein